MKPSKGVRVLYNDELIEVSYYNDTNLIEALGMLEAAVLTVKSAMVGNIRETSEPAEDESPADHPLEQKP